MTYTNLPINLAGNSGAKTGDFKKTQKIQGTTDDVYAASCPPYSSNAISISQDTVD